MTADLESWETIALDDLKHLARSGAVLRHVLAYDQVRMLTYRVGLIRKPFAIALLLRFLARGSCEISDQQGKRLAVTVGLLLKLARKILKDRLRMRGMVRRRLAEVNRRLSETTTRLPHSFRRGLDRSASPIYLRTSLEFGIQSGGSIGHIAGVLNSLGAFLKSPILLSTDLISTVRPDLDTYLIIPDEAYWDFPEIQELYFSKIFEQQASQLIQDLNVVFIYQRYSLNNYSGLILAKTSGVPFVLEYNGSEIWMARNWGRPLRFEQMAESIELLNLRSADLIVVGSRILLEKLAARGINRDSILVNPNGVDTNMYSPYIDDKSVRQRYGLSGKTVVGFIGSFGRWHGAEVLARGFGLLLQTHPEYLQQVKLLMIGDGVTMGQVKAALVEFGVQEQCVLTRSIPQEDGPSHLAACDILVSPHVPNRDQSQFFGSPTKVYEYMAMGKGIVASDLGQIGEVLQHDRTAILTIPGDDMSLAEGIRSLIENKELRERLGKAARAEVVEKYTWMQLRKS